MLFARSRVTALSAGLASAVITKWAFDCLLWDASFRWLAHMVDFETAEAVTEVLSYLLPLTAAAATYSMLSPRPPEQDDRVVLRKPPWQSQYLIVGVTVIVAAIVAGLSYGRVFGMPSMTLPQTR